MAPRQYHNVSPTTVGYGCNASLASPASASSSSSSSSSSSLAHGSPRNLDPTGHHDAQTPATATAKANETANANGDNRSLSTPAPTPAPAPAPLSSDRAWRHKLLALLRTVCQTKTFRYGTAAGMILAAVACAMRPPPNGNGNRPRRAQMRMRILSLLSMVARLGAPGAIANPTSAASASAINTSSSTTLSTTLSTSSTTPTPTRTTRGTGLAQFCGALCAALVRSLRSPDYANADSASLGWLKSAAERGLVQKALIGATHILVRVGTHRDNNNNIPGGWKKTALPPRSEGLKTDLVELLSKGGCQEIAALPDTFWDRIATPLLTALPFLYLALAYRMLKGLHNGNLDGEDFFSSKLLPSSRRRGGNHHYSNNNNGEEEGKRARITLDDVAGLDAILPEVREIVSYLRDPSGFVALGAELPRGILLHGSPGVGKTMIARAIAGEADCDAFCVCSGSDFCEVYVGRGAGRVRALFREARATALENYRRRQRAMGGKRGWARALASAWPFGRGTGSAAGGDDDDSSNNNPTNSNSNKHDDTNDNDNDHNSHRHPCRRPPTAIIFIDELDAVAKSRSYGGAANGNDERDQTLNQLLTEMDGFFRDHANTNASRSRRRRGGGGGGGLNFDNYYDSDYDDDDDRVNTLVIAATNRPELLDPAILRRFDRHIGVPHPDARGRADILRVHARARTTRCRFSTIHWDHLAGETSGFSGSDLRQVVNDAALLAVRQGSKHVEQGHLLRAIQRARATRVRHLTSGGGGGSVRGLGSSYPASSMLPFVYGL